MGFGKCDFRQLAKLTENVKALNDGIANNFTKDVANEIALRLIRMIKQKTPVNTGTLRNGWSVNIIENGKNYTIEIINPIEYASEVEYGHRQEAGRYVPALGKKLKKSWVQGKFMMTMSISEINQLTPRIVEDKVWKEIKRCFNAK